MCLFLQRRLQSCEQCANLINEDGKLNQSSDVIRASEEEEPEPELVVAEQQVRSGGTLTMSMVVSILNHALYLQ